LLLILRISIYESGLFEQVKKQPNTRRGDLRMLLATFERTTRYLRCILIGLPTWFVIGILITLSPELCRSRGLEGVNGGDAIMYSYIGLVLGDFSSGLLSQWLKSRRQAVIAFLALTAVSTVMNVSLGSTPQEFYWLALLAGFGVGYWAMFVTIAAEQFGTNLRATVATTVPNWARGALVPMTTGFLALRGTGLSPIQSALIVGFVSIALAVGGAWGIKETFGKDLEYLET
jgi:hypothetical protein